MIPHTYPTFVDARKQGYMRVFFLTSVTGLTKWVDYIPVKTVAFSAANEGTTNANGHMTVMQVASSTALAAWRDYVPVFEDGSATVAWSSGSNGYIPVCQALNLDFTAPILDSRITFTRADATSCATYFDSTGRLQTAAANVARFDYDPATVAGVTGGELAAPLTAGNYTLGGTSSFSGGGVTTAGTSSFGSIFSKSGFTLTIGKTYLISATIANKTSGNTIAFQFGSSNALVTAVSNGTASAYWKCDNSSGLGVIEGNGLTWAGSITAFSVQEVTFTPRGLLIEESRTNLLLQSRDMTNAAWTKTDVTPTRNQVGIDGVANTACLMTEGTLLTALTTQTVTVSAGATINASMVFKRGNTDWVCWQVGETSSTDFARMWANLSTGAIGSVTAFGAATATSGAVTNLGGGWYRLALTVLPNGTYTTGRATFFSASANGTTTRVSGATYIVDAAQLEVASNADTAIATAASTVTRALDLPLMSGSNFSSWFNAPAFTFVATVTTIARSGFPNILGLSDGAATDFLHIFVGAGASTFAVGAVMQSGGAIQFNTQAGAYANGTKVKVSLAASATGWSLVVNGVQILSGGAITMPTLLNRLAIGAKPDGTASLNGPVERVQFYPTKLTTAQQIALTS